MCDECVAPIQPFRFTASWTSLTCSSIHRYSHHLLEASTLTQAHGQQTRRMAALKAQACAILCPPVHHCAADSKG